MDKQTELEILDSLNAIGMDSKTFFSSVQDALGHKNLPEEKFRQALKGFELCINHAPDADPDPTHVWKWFSQLHIPALGTTLLGASIMGDAQAVVEYLKHLQDGGYA